MLDGTSRQGTLSAQMKLLVSGASGFVGSALTPFLKARGHTVRRLVRGSAARGPDEILWEPSEGRLDPAALSGLDAVVHLAGARIAPPLWTPAHKRRIRESRVVGTRLVAERMAQASHPPRVLVCTSAVGFYGDRDDEILTEASPRGRGFLADVCEAWEAAAGPARQAGLRVVHLRLGMVVDPRGGALEAMLLPFRLGLGGRLGGGRQWWSWISMQDLLDIFLEALEDPALSGPVNATTPHPVTNANFTAALARRVRRPALVPVPAWALRLALGEMAQEVLLASARALPRALELAGFRFLLPHLPEALERCL